MDPVIVAAVGLAALACLFALWGLESWRADARKRQDAVNRRLYRD